MLWRPSHCWDLADHPNFLTTFFLKAHYMKTMPTPLIELEEINLATINDDQLESYSPINAIVTQWTCGNMTICGCY